MHSCIRTCRLKNLLRRIFPLFQSPGRVCARLCYFFLKCLTNFTGEAIGARRVFWLSFCFVSFECGKVLLWPFISKNFKHTEHWKLCSELLGTHCLCTLIDILLSLSHIFPSLEGKVFIMVSVSFGTSLNLSFLINWHKVVQNNFLYFSELTVVSCFSQFWWFLWVFIRSLSFSPCALYLVYKFYFQRIHHFVFDINFLLYISLVSFFYSIFPSVFWVTFCCYRKLLEIGSVLILKLCFVI